jgi:hypothetical protein
MQLAENALPLLLEELNVMPARDRRAILARLSSGERERLAQLARPTSAVQAPARSSDIEARIAALRAGDTGAMTQVAAEALRRLLDIGPVSDAAARKPQPGASLMDSFGTMLRRGRGSA